MSDVDDPTSEAVEKPLRLNQDVREALLRANEGFVDPNPTYYSSKNYSEQRDYSISGGALHVRSRSKTSWADSRRDDTFVADEAATHRYLRDHLGILNTEGVRESAVSIRAERKAAEAAAQAVEQARAAEEASAPSFPTDAEDSDLTEVSGLANGNGPQLPSLKVVLVSLAVVGGVIVAAPHIKSAWKTKVKPKVDEWRARRRATTQATEGEPSTSTGDDDLPTGEPPAVDDQQR